MSVRVSVPKERLDGEARVALTPDAVKRLASDDITIAVEASAGASAGFLDAEYSDAGAEIVADRAALLGGADIVFKVAPPGEDEASEIREGAVLACLLRPHENADLFQRLASRNVTALALELVPRITRAQSMDALSSQSNLAGYKAVVRGADALGRIFPLLMTAA
ncbi:MAG: NAD(P)(+) transhydrogenase (Re/Si-specific) subunit alpha, partial [Gemmatimonadetes bacterium]|nr:NAD(P)(+) transhydrogenase (Re/Si-specific) subunit alpha [Gemmatimonadota bacterium]